MCKRQNNNTIPGSTVWTLNSTIASLDGAISALEDVIEKNEALKRYEETLKQEIERLNTALKNTYKKLTQCNTAYISVSSEKQQIAGHCE